MASKTTEERKTVFAKNLDRLICEARLSRKKAAEKIGLPYGWVRKMATEGTSRPDERNLEYLHNIIEFFAVPSVDHLWHDDLIDWLLVAEEGKRFRECFGRDRQSAVNGVEEQRISDAAEIVQRIELLQEGKVEQRDVSGRATKTYTDKLTFLLSTGQHDYLKSLIDDLCWCHLLQTKESVDEADEEQAGHRSGGRQKKQAGRLAN